MRVLPLILALSCAGSTPDAEEPTPVPAEQAERVAETYESPVTSGEIARADLVLVLDAGLGRFLQGVDLTPDMREGEFHGFRINQLYPDDPRFTALDLQPGDVVTRVNGQSIERPEHALRVWNSLRVASELLIEYEHEGELKQLRFAIL